MSDIIVICRRGRAFIYYETELGKQWLVKNTNFDVKEENHISMDTDFIEDFVDEMRKDSLEVDLK